LGKESESEDDTNNHRDNWIIKKISSCNIHSSAKYQKMALERMARALKKIL
jgi:hypothetical protein